MVAKLKAAAANPVNPTFNHYMFETIAALVKNVCSVHSSALAAFDSTLCPLVREILDQDVAEFAPYGFQLLAQLLDLHKTTGTNVPPDYLAMLPPLLMPVFWERPGYVPALTPLIVGFMHTAAEHIVANEQVRQHSPALCQDVELSARLVWAEQIQPVLGVFQKLIASKANDHHGFALITGMMRSLPLAAIQPYLATVFQLLFQRLSSLKTHKFVRGFIGFMSVVVCSHGAAQLFELVNAVQPNIMMMVLDQVWLPGLGGINGRVERKVAAVALIKLVCDCPALRDPVHLAQWNKAAANIVPLLESVGQEEDADENDGACPRLVAHRGNM